MRPKGWSKFQHYKDRRPPWIKLHHDLLDNEDYAELDAEAAKYLPLIWLIASEYENGELPAPKTLAYRLRVSISKVTQILSNLSAWLEEDAINPLPKVEQVAVPETEAERETEKEGERASALAPPLNADPADNIPEGLTLIEYSREACGMVGIAKTLANRVALEHGIEAIRDDERVSLAEATRRLVLRGRDHPPNDGKWSFWVSDGGWKEREQVGVSIEGLE